MLPGKPLTARYAVIHGGECHRDELYSVGLAANLGLISTVIGSATEVYRRDPTEEDLRDPMVLVMDVGRRLQPERLNFDHHMLPREQLDCTLSLMAKHYEVPERTRQHFGWPEPITFHALWEDAPWYRAVVIKDVRGGRGLAKALGLNDIPEELANNGVEKFVLSEIGRTDRVSPFWTAFANNLVWSKIGSSFAHRRDMLQLEKRGEFVPTGIGNLEVFDAHQMGPSGINTFLRKHQEHPVVATISDEPRNGLTCLFRTELGEAWFDFSRFEGRPGVNFAHKGGFVVNIGKDVPRDKIIAMLREIYEG